jgi:FkbM family methyltransferase
MLARLLQAHPLLWCPRLGSHPMARLAGLVTRLIRVPEQRPFLPPGRVRPFVDWARNRATPAVARRREHRLFRALASACTLYLDMFANVCYELRLNGELRVLESLAESGPRCIFDVGSNLGEWSIAAATLYPEAQIEAFEIVPDTASRMQERLTRSGLSSSVKVNAIGLSEDSATVSVAYLPTFSEGSSAAVVQPAGEVQWLECPVRTGEDYCREHSIEHIDFLKMDVEGLESKVLKGFATMLAGAKIDAVQFEYGHLNASVRFLLGDFYDLFAGYGYLIGKIFPNYVDFRTYDAWRDEDFRGSNYVAVHQDRGDLVRRLAKRK